MRIFSISKNGEFEEFSKVPFQVEHEEKILESWLESNPDGILEDGDILDIGRQITTNLGSIIDEPVYLVVFFDFLKNFIQ